MTLVVKNKELVVEFNGSKTWFVSYIGGDCLGHFTTQRRAMNAFEKHSKLLGV